MPVWPNLVEASDLGSEGWGFESLHRYKQYIWEAELQRMQHGLLNRWVG